VFSSCLSRTTRSRFSADSQFDVYTGNRSYQNILVAWLRTTTNSGLEYSFVAGFVLCEIILVSTQTLGTGALELQQFGVPGVPCPAALSGPRRRFAGEGPTSAAASGPDKQGSQ